MRGQKSERLEKSVKWGRPSKAAPDVSPGAVKRIRNIAKAYGDAKLRVRYYENVRGSLLYRAGIDPKRCEESGCVTYDADEVKKYPEKDRAVLYQYIADKQAVLCMEKGIAAIEDAATREIARRAIIEGQTCESIASETGVSRRSVFREKDRAYRWIAHRAIIDRQLPE